MNPLNNQRGEEWDTCDKCGRLFPISMLSRQLGLKVCERDRDNLDNQRRPQIIASILETPEAVPDQHQDLYADTGEMIF